MENRKTTMMMTLIMVLFCTGVSVVNEAPEGIAHSEMNDEEMMLIAGLHDLVPKSRRRPSATEAKNARRGFQILDSLGLCFGRDEKSNLVLMPQPSQTRSGWGVVVAVAVVVAIAAINPAFGLAGAVGAVLKAPEAETEKPAKVDFKALLKEKAEEQTWAIVKPMLEGELPAWVRPWKCGDVDVTVPFNADPTSQAHNGFKGGNRIRLSPLWSGYNIPMWATTKQWYAVAKRIGFDYSKVTGQPVIKESARDAFTVTLRPLQDRTNTWFEKKIDRHGNPVVNPKTGKAKLVKRFGVQFGKFAYTAMLNIEQTNLPVDAVAALADFTMNQPERTEIEGASDIDEMCMKNVTGTTLNHGGNRACFWPSRDHIDMPHPDTFTENGVSALDAYSATLLHEFAHASGHYSRLRRSQKSGGELNYAKEELVAEMASMICCFTLGIEMDGPIHGTYLKGWANRAIGQHQKDKDSDKWMAECQTLLRKAMEASEWVLYGTMPEWLQRERTRPSKDEDKTEGDEDAQDAEIVFYRATIEEINGGGSDAPFNDSEAVYAAMGLVSTTTTGDVHYGPYSPADSIRHDGVIHHAEEFSSIEIPGDDFDTRILCLGTGEVLATMKIGEGWLDMGYDENGEKVTVRYPEIGWVSIPKEMRAIGAFGLIPALLDPSMVSMVALGVAMMVGLHGGSHKSEVVAHLRASLDKHTDGWLPLEWMMDWYSEQYSAIMDEAHERESDSLETVAELMIENLTQLAYNEGRVHCIPDVPTIGETDTWEEDNCAETPEEVEGCDSPQCRFCNPVWGMEESAHSAVMPLGLGLALLDPSMASMVALGIAMVVGMTKKVYFIKQKETISHTWAIEAESWDDAMEKYEDDCHCNAIGGEALRDSWEYHGDGARTKAGMVKVNPCINYYKDSKAHWVKGKKGNFNSFTNICLNNECISEEDYYRVPNSSEMIRIGSGYKAVLNEEGVCRGCLEREENEHVLTPMDTEELERYGMTEEASMGAIGAMGIIPALLDPSMVSLVALGVAMVVGMTGFDRDTLLKEEEGATDCINLSITKESMATPKTFEVDHTNNPVSTNDRSYRMKEVMECVGRHWHQMLVWGEKEIIEAEEINLVHRGNPTQPAARPDSTPHIQISNGGSVRSMTHRVWYSEEILLNLTMVIEEGDDGKKKVEIGVVGLEMESDKSYAKNVFNVGFDITSSMSEAPLIWVFQNYMGWDDLTFPRLEHGDMTYEWIGISARMFDFIEGAFDTLFGTSHGGLEEDENGYIIVKDEDIVSGLTTEWAKYGAGAVRDAAAALHGAYEATLVSRGWHEATEEAQRRLESIQRYGCLPNDLDADSSNSKWLKLSQNELATLCRDLGVTTGYADPRATNDIKEAFSGFRWTQNHGTTFDEDTVLTTKDNRYGDYLTKQGMVTLLKALLNREATFDANEAVFKEASREYVKQCAEGEVDTMEAIISMGRFEEIETSLKALGSTPVGRAFLHIWANPPNDYNQSERAYFFDGDVITISRVYCDRDFDDGSVAEDILGMMLEEPNSNAGILQGNALSLSRTVKRLVSHMRDWETFANRIQDVAWGVGDVRSLDELPPYIRATVERRFPTIVEEPEEEEEAEAMGAIGAFALLPALLDPSMTTLVALAACVALSMVKADPVVALPPSDDLKALWSQKHGWGLRTGTEDYKIMQTCLHDRVEILLAHLPEAFFDVESEGTMYVPMLRERVESGEDISVSMVERVEEEVRPWNAEPWKRYVNALYDANLLDCTKSRFPEADRYQDGWCGCCAKPAMMDNPDNVVFQWWMRPTNLDGFTKMANRIARAFNRRDLGFWFEAGDASPQKNGERTVWRLPMTVIHSPLTDSGWVAQAIIEPFDPARIKEGTDALVTMVPTGIEKATYDMKLEDGTTEAVTYDRAVWEEKTSIEVSEYLTERHDGASIFQYDPTICDHCGKKVHNRKKLVVVKHEDEGQRIVGSSCLYEYTDIDPKTLENLFNLHKTFDPYDGVATNPQSWKDSLARRDLEDFLEPLGVLIAHKGRYMKGSGMGSQAFSMVMGRDLAEKMASDTEGRSIVADMAYYWYRGFRGDPKKTGWYPISNVAIDQTLAREVREYIMASIEENVNKVKAGIKSFEIGDFGMKLAIVGRAGYVTAVRKGKMSATVNIVAGASSRYFKEKQKEEKVVLEAYPAEVGKTWTGSIQAVVTAKRSGHGYYGEWFITEMVVDGKYKMTTFSEQRAFLDSKIGDTVEITKFNAKEIKAYRDETSLVIGGSVIAKGVKA